MSERQPHIRCPQCAWEPVGEDRWHCSRAGCDTVWNTFWTRGVCPGCGHHWRNTQCLACGEFSPHPAWYHLPEDVAEDRTQAAELEAST